MASLKGKTSGSSRGKNVPPANQTEPFVSGPVGHGSVSVKLASGSGKKL